MKRQKILQAIRSGSKNIRFGDFEKLLDGFGFRFSRKDGSHHIYSKNGIPELVNIQNVKGQVKPYQIKQFLKLVEKYNLILDDEQ